MWLESSTYKTLSLIVSHLGTLSPYLFRVELFYVTLCCYCYPQLDFGLLVSRYKMKGDQQPLISSRLPLILSLMPNGYNRMRDIQRDTTITCMRER
jgi:hypothetical protein